MSLISLRLPDALDSLLNQEAKASKRAKSEIARTAIADYLKKQERERFMAAYVRSIASRDPGEALAMAEEFLPLENEALALAESGGRSRALAAWESRSPYASGPKTKPAATLRRRGKRRAR
jgi:predicted transcriptional regulator